VAIDLEEHKHSLEQLATVMDMYRKPPESLRTSLFLATQLVNHGYAEAAGLIGNMAREHRIEAVRYYLGRLLMRHKAIRALPGLHAVFSDPVAMQQLYATEGHLFRRGRERADTAVVIFTTMYNNFNFSNAVLDAALSGLGVSRLFLKDTSPYLYLRGVKGVASDLRELPESITALLQRHGVKRYIITGHSSGGYAALYVAQRTQPVGFVGYGMFTDIADGSSVTRPAIYEKIRHEMPGELYMNLAAFWDGPTGSFPGYAFYGEPVMLDREHAELLRGRGGITVTPLRDSLHNVTSYLLEEGQFLKPFETLLGD
jgi:hypothetical protein